MASVLEIRFSTAPIYVRGKKCRLSPPVPSRSVLPGWLKPIVERSPNSFLKDVGLGFLEANGLGYTLAAPFNFQLRDEADPEAPDKRKLVQKMPKDIPASEYEHWAPFPDTHTRIQFAGAPWESEGVVKMRGFWYIETPPGYSCLFLPPSCRTEKELPVAAIPGVVETDRYKNLINFPMIRCQPFPVTVIEGTPLMQVIPFKRDDWISEIGWVEEETGEESQKGDDDG